jgi:hypothetical protein
LHNSRICCLWCGLKTYYNWHRIDQFLPLTIEVFVCLHKHANVFTRLCQCHLELEGDKRPLSFYLGHFFSSKSFDHTTKDANVFHFKLGDSHKLSYGLTSTFSRHISHQHNWFIASHQFLTCKYG